VVLITVEKNVENAVEERDNRNPNRDKVLLGDNRSVTCGKLYLRSLIWLGLMYPPFWFSMLKYKIGYTHITGRNSRSNNIRKPHLIS